MPDNLTETLKRLESEWEERGKRASTLGIPKATCIRGGGILDGIRLAMKAVGVQPNERERGRWPMSKYAEVFQPPLDNGTVGEQ